MRGRPIQIADFVEYHRPALETHEARYNLILGLLANATSAAGLRLWSLGEPGACAVQFPGRPIVLGALSEPQCHRVARETSNLAFPGVVGCDDTARWFVDHATSLGMSFLDPIPQQILVLTTAPKYPGAPGYARQVRESDAGQFLSWMRAFSDEAVPHDPQPTREQLEPRIAEGRCFFWIVNGQPASMAIIARRTRNSAAISGVYTPPLLRGRGYAGSVTAAVAERIFAEGRTAACLYTDLRNPFSNRCYAKIGFIPVCSSYHYVRVPPGPASTRRHQGIKSA